MRNQLPWMGDDGGTSKVPEWYTCYLIEESLSLDNLFAFYLVFRFFKVRYTINLEESICYKGLFATCMHFLWFRVHFQYLDEMDYPRDEAYECISGVISKTNTSHNEKERTSVYFLKIVSPISWQFSMCVLGTHWISEPRTSMGHCWSNCHASDGEFMLLLITWCIRGTTLCLPYDRNNQGCACASFILWYSADQRCIEIVTSPCQSVHLETVWIGRTSLQINNWQILSSMIVLSVVL